MKTHTKNPIQNNEIYPTNNWGDITVIDYVHAKHVIIQFNNTSNISTAHSTSIRSRHVTDREERQRLSNEREKDRKEGIYKRREALTQANHGRRIAREQKAAQDAIDKRMEPSVYGIGYLGVGEYQAYIAQSVPT
tara:strand:- start:204 stop:608 length:405 start_codon:yes stop_codon:yes gene_type:complete